MKEYILPENGIYYRANDFEAAKQTIVFIHGLSGCSSAWEPYEREFMGRYNIVSIDLRGHGRSKKYAKESDYAISLFVDDIEAVLAHLLIEECIVTSHSFGSVISVGLISRDSSKAKGAIFLAPAFEPKHSARTIVTVSVAWLLKSLLKAFPISTKSGKRTDYSRIIPTSDWDMRRIYLDLRNTGLAIYFFCLYTLYRSMDDSVFGQLHLPSLIMHGQKDSYVSLKNSVRASKEISGSRLVVLPGADHMLVFDYPKEISKAMTEFLALIPSSKA